MKTLPLILLLIAFSHSARAETLQLSGFQMEDGAITVRYKGDVVDPYFATKVLLLAAANGFNIAAPAHRWIGWLIGRQLDDGLFQRYRRVSGAAWQPYAAADADDAALALWLELLQRAGNGTALEKKSAVTTQRTLDGLYDPSLGIYHISQAQPVGLFMDNVEVATAFTAISHQLAERGQHRQAEDYAARTQRLKENIRKIFWDGKKFRVSTQDGTAENSFYPGTVAQLFPLLYARRDAAAETTYRIWMTENRKSWLAMPRTDYAWGLVALIALRMGDADSAFCWQVKAEPFRYSAHWDVLEEVALQIVKKQLAAHPPSVAVACTGEMT